MQTTILDYIKWRGDLTFCERSFCEVDNLILSELVYYEFGEVINGSQDPITVQEAYEAYQKLENPYPYATNNPLPLLEACAHSERFGQLLVSHFVDSIDQNRQMQFSAACFHLPNQSLFVAFRGTDNTIVGWREDFNLSYMEEAPAQAEAVLYLDRILAEYDCPIIVGGHSKGGHLSIYASAFCKHMNRKNIEVIYSNDGPGFNDYISSSPKYQAILPKVKLIIPEASIVSILYNNKKEKEVISCTTTNGAQQHSPYTWLVERDHFVQADAQSSLSVILDETLSKWLASLDDTQKEEFVSAIFDAMDASGAVTLAEMTSNKWTSYNAILNAIKQQPHKTKDVVIDAIRQLGNAHKDVLWNETKKIFESKKNK